MIKKALCCIMLLCVILSGGCWNYRGLNEMSIVSGFAIDKDDESGDMKVSFQIVDLVGNIQVEGINGKLIESTGKTLFDAGRNAKRNIIGKLYFGHTQLVVISQDIARNEDLKDTIDWMLHDAEMRETLKIAISAGDTAKEILNFETIVGPIVAFDVSKYIEEDQKITASVTYKQLYEVYNTLESEGIDLTLPAICNVENNGEPSAKLCGTAVFKGQRLAGFLNPDETKYLLFTTDELEGGLLTFPADGEGEDDTTLEIYKNKTKRSFSYKEGKLVIKLEPETDVYLAECKVHLDALDKKQISSLEQNAAKALAERMAMVIGKVQSEYGADIFGFGNMIYKKDIALWSKLSSDWDTLFPELEVVINAKVNIVNTASIKE
jgi:spore germination protein KC